MGKKDKTKNCRAPEISSIKDRKKLEKRLRKLESQLGEPSIEELIDNFRQKQKSKSGVTVTPSDPPSPRTHFVFIPCADSHELFLYGGEFFDGKKVTMLSDLFIFHCKEKKWWSVESSVAPPPRSGHQAVYVKSTTIPSSLWMFGGEFASPTQSRFHHYQDLWRLQTRTRKWQQINAGGPSARSGHRMFFWKSHILLFGGFNDIGSKTVYFNDLWQFDISTLQWTILSLHGDIPSPRSACHLFPANDQKHFFILGGYSKIYISRDVEKGVAHSDFTSLTMEKDLGTVQCVSVRPTGARPNPTRCSMAGVCLDGNRALLFGGVHDLENDDDTLKSHFHNDLFSFNLRQGKWSHFHYPPITCTKVDSCTVTSSRPIDSLSLSDSFSNVSVTEDKTLKRNDNHLSFQLPPPRASAGMAVLDNILYIYGGMFEVGDKKITLDDFYCLDLNCPTSWNCIYPGTQENQVWLGSDSEDDDEEEDECDNRHKTKTCTMDVDSKSDDSTSDEDEELVDDAPMPNPLETFTNYWNRTSNFWCDLVVKGEDQPSNSNHKSVILNVAQKLSKDFYDTHHRG